MVAQHDAVVIGAGPNGLVAANLLVDAGWSVSVLEAQDEVGGAVRSDRELHPDYVHDTFSAFYPMAAASATIQALELERHGLEWAHAPAVLGHPLPDGGWALLHRDRHDTARGLDSHHPGDGEAWLELCAQWDRVGDDLVRAVLGSFPPVRAGVSVLARLRSVGGLDFVRDLLTPVASLGRHRFGGEGARLLLAGNAAHADIPLDAAGSSVLGLILTLVGQQHGYPVPVGGAGRLTQALADRLVSVGGEIRLGHEVTGIDVDRRRVVAVRTADARFAVRRAVLADVTAPALYERLLAPEDVPARIARGMRSFELDPGTVKVDWALDGPVPWRDVPEVAPGTVHVADSVAEMARALSEVTTGGLPEKPFLLMGQMTTSDPTRSPAGTESLWAYTHVPHRMRDDAAEGSGIRGTWDADDRERFADRMQEQLVRYAPDLESRIVARRVLGPREMRERNANLDGGSLNGGTAALHQQLVFRPVPGQFGRPETGVRGLYLASSSAHPGGGVHGAPGANAARAALFHHRVRTVLPRR